MFNSSFTLFSPSIAIVPEVITAVRNFDHDSHIFTYCVRQKVTECTRKVSSAKSNKSSKGKWRKSKDRSDFVDSATAMTNVDYGVRVLMSFGCLFMLTEHTAL